MENFNSFGQMINFYKFNTNIFIPYMKFIESKIYRKDGIGKKRMKSRGFELHHILPRSIGGLNKGRNIAALYPDEHMVAHNLLQSALWKQYEKNGNIKALKMFRSICGSKNIRNKMKELYNSNVILKSYMKRKSEIKLLEMK